MTVQGPLLGSPTPCSILGKSLAVTEFKQVLTSLPLTDWVLEYIPIHNIDVFKYPSLRTNLMYRLQTRPENPTKFPLTTVAQKQTSCEWTPPAPHPIAPLSSCNTHGHEASERIGCLGLTRPQVTPTVTKLLLPPQSTKLSSEI